MDFQDASKALENTNGKPLRGRKLVVTFAHQAPLVNAAYGGRTKGADYHPTNLSLVKSTGVGRSEASVGCLVYGSPAFSQHSFLVKHRARLQ